MGISHESAGLREIFGPTKLSLKFVSTLVGVQQKNIPQKLFYYNVTFAYPYIYDAVSVKNSFVENYKCFQVF